MGEGVLAVYGADPEGRLLTRQWGPVFDGAEFLSTTGINRERAPSARLDLVETDGRVLMMSEGRLRQAACGAWSGRSQIPEAFREETMTDWLDQPVFLAGATGFIGQHLHPRLVEAGLDIRCGTRSTPRARARQPGREWVEFDVDQPATIPEALAGCGSAFYLIHQMAGGPGYHERERQAAHAFSSAAEAVGVKRVVYLGGVAPSGAPSEHLSSRLQTGRILRTGEVPTIELRASMIIGPGSASWQIVRDLAARLPLMVLPAWTQSRTEPVYIADVADALVGALMLDEPGSRWYDIPGPEVLSVEQILERTARALGHDARQVHVPLLSPRLSSYWLRFVTRADLNIARELVEGLQSDLLASGDEFWGLIGHPDRVGFDEAALRTIAKTRPESMLARTYERLIGTHSIKHRPESFE